MNVAKDKAVSVLNSVPDNQERPARESRRNGEQREKELCAKADLCSRESPASLRPDPAATDSCTTQEVLMAFQVKLALRLAGDYGTRKKSVE